MSGWVFWSRMFVALTYGGILAFFVWDRRERDSSGEGSGQRYLMYISSALLPTAIATLAVLALWHYGVRGAVGATAGFCFSVFLQIALYDLLLMPALPLLRRHISARTCAALWMVPNYLYITQMSYMPAVEPRWVLEVPAALTGGLAALWLAGFCIVLGWKIVSHLAFRAQILRDARPVTDEAVLAVWRREVEAARFQKPKFRLVVSPAVRTPLSVGLFRRSVRVVLPERAYTEEELALVLRHELVHIGREDAVNKFFLVFCTAMCWFNPLMWAAMEKSAQDLELSCDETVLLDAGEETRRRYAGLLLRTAGDQRGFTTCLSASAGALRYRLRSVMRPGKRRSGALAVGLAFFLLCMSSGYAALAAGRTAGAEAVFGDRAPEEYAVYHASWVGGPELVCADEAALRDWLSALELSPVMGLRSPEVEGWALHLYLDGPEDRLLSVDVSDRFVRLQSARTGFYYLPEGVDWAGLEACFEDPPGWEGSR